eukprot:TRINITY_DN2690_c0_g1_i4.p1 TRINITY_DN2690_c0_g1~~TRINITY_DN2690_c0_g1_i4.p1  ORF type:complete len:1220 (-),score=502.91 TRINITY_DN2690_c0_g1_i4:125-3784(-)
MFLLLQVLALGAAFAAATTNEAGSDNYPSDGWSTDRDKLEDLTRQEISESEQPHNRWAAWGFHHKKVEIAHHEQHKQHKEVVPGNTRLEADLDRLSSDFSEEKSSSDDNQDSDDDKDSDDTATTAAADAVKVGEAVRAVKRAEESAFVEKAKAESNELTSKTQAQEAFDKQVEAQKKHYLQMMKAKSSLLSETHVVESHREASKEVKEQVSHESHVAEAIANMKVENTKLKKEVDTLEATAKLTKADAEARIASLEEKLAAAEAQAEEAKGALEVAQADEKELREKLAKVQVAPSFLQIDSVDASHMKRQLQADDDEIKRLKELNDRLLETAKKKDEALEQERQLLEAPVYTMADKIAGGDEHIEAVRLAEKSAEALKVELKKSQRVVGAAKQKAKTAEDEANTFKAEIALLKAQQQKYQKDMKMANDRVEMEVQQSQKLKLQLMSASKDADARVSKVRADSMKMQQEAVAEREALAKERVQLKTEEAQLQSRTAMLQSQVSDYSARLKDAEAVGGKKVAVLAGQVDSERKIIDKKDSDLKKEIQEVNTVKDELKTITATSKKDEFMLRGELDKETRMAAELKDKLKTGHAALQAKVDALNAQLLQMKTSKTQAEEEATLLRGKLEHKEHETSEVRAQLMKEHNEQQRKAKQTKQALYDEEKRYQDLYDALKKSTLKESEDAQKEVKKADAKAKKAEDEEFKAMKTLTDMKKQVKIDRERALKEVDQYKAAAAKKVALSAGEKTELSKLRSEVEQEREAVKRAEDLKREEVAHAKKAQMDAEKEADFKVRNKLRMIEEEKADLNRELSKIKTKKEADDDQLAHLKSQVRNLQDKLLDEQTAMGQQTSRLHAALLQENQNKLNLMSIGQHKEIEARKLESDMQKSNRRLQAEVTELKAEYARSMRQRKIQEDADDEKINKLASALEADEQELMEMNKHLGEEKALAYDARKTLAKVMDFNKRQVSLENQKLESFFETQKNQAEQMKTTLESHQRKEEKVLNRFNDDVAKLSPSKQLSLASQEDRTVQHIVQAAQRQMSVDSQKSAPEEESGAIVDQKPETEEPAIVDQKTPEPAEAAIAEQKATEPAAPAIVDQNAIEGDEVATKIKAEEEADKKKEAEESALVGDKADEELGKQIHKLEHLTADAKAKEDKVKADHPHAPPKRNLRHTKPLPDHKVFEWHPKKEVALAQEDDSAEGDEPTEPTQDLDSVQDADPTAEQL